MSDATEPVAKIAADGRINVISPLDGRVVERIASTAPDDLAGRAAQARDVQAAWAARPLADRAKVVRRLAGAIAAAGDDLVEVLRVEVGRHPAESWFAEVVPNIELVHWWCKQGRKHLAPQKIGLNPISYPFKSARVEAVPRGVLGLITPWNYPAAIPLRALVPAALAGNAVLWKPSEYSALVAARLGAILDEVLPEGLVQVIQGDGTVGAALLEVVDGIGFTGSLATGRKIAVRAAERMIPCSTELGGKDFAVVLPDADLKRTAAGIAWGALTNAGQNCASIEVVCVHQAVADRFTDQLREEVRKMAPFVGPVINPQQKAKIVAQLEAAATAGALVSEGGLAGAEGLRVEPTVVERVAWDAPLICEETFGPVLPVQVIGGLDEVAQHLNESAYGLSMSLWTRDVESARRWATGQPVGVVTINNHGFTPAIPAMPWTGVKGSGVGVTNGPWSLEWMIRPQGFLVDKAKARELWWHPFNEAAVRLARGMARLTGGVGGKLAAIKDVLGGMLGRWKGGA